MVTYRHLSDKIADCKERRITALDLAEWACKVGSRLPDELVVPVELAALSFFLERICEEGPTFLYTYDWMVFDELLTDITACLNKDRPWEEVMNLRVTGDLLLAANVGTIARCILEQSGIGPIESRQVYDIHYKIRILGECTEISSVCAAPV